MALTKVTPSMIEGSTDGKFTFSMINGAPANVLDFGADPTGVEDSTAAIQAAIDASDVIYFGGAENTYKITETLDLSAGNKTLIGEGAVIDQTGITTGNKWAMKAVGELSTTTSLLTATATNEDYSCTVASATGFAAGDWILISGNGAYTHYDNPSYIVYAGEFVRIRSIVGTTINFTTPLVSSPAAGYTTANSSRITKVNFCENINISGLTFQGSATAGAGERGLVLQYVNGFDVENCTFNGQDIYQFEVTMTIRGNITNNKFYGVFYDGSTGTIFYGLVFVDSSQYVNVGDNIFERVRHGVTTVSKTFGQGGWGQPLYINIHHNQMFDAMAGGAGRSWGFEQHGFGKYISFNNNMVNGGYGGVNVDAGFQVEILNNVFTNLTKVGIDLGGDAVNLGNILIAGNHISVETDDATLDSYGIWLEDGITTSARDIIISDNYIIGFDSANSVGILLNTTPTELAIVVKNNTLSTGGLVPDTNSGYGITCYSNNTEITGNQVINYRQGIYSAGSYNTVANNIVRYTDVVSAGYGYYLDDSFQVLKDNTYITSAIPTGGNAIALSADADSCIVDNNDIMRCYVGINILSGATNNTVVNNTIVGNVSTNIIDGGTTTNKVNNN